MNRLVNDLLDVASIEAGKLALFPAPVEIAHLLRDTLDAFEPIAAAKRVALDAHVDGAPSAWLDEGRILQVLANLVGNGIKFTPAEGRVSIEAHIDRAEVHFTVTDTGIGVPADAREGVFERFRQVRSDPRGLGLGLHIARSIVVAHGGRMWVEDRPGGGSAFHFSLPVGADGQMNPPASPPRAADD
jgi:signal transduction histidine kinase